jgi:hypothetical protein
MAKEQYFVFFDRGVWKIKHQDRELESYATQKAALKDAIHFARHEGAKGHEAHVLLQGNDKLFDWIYGVDPRSSVTAGRRGGRSSPEA